MDELGEEPRSLRWRYGRLAAINILSNITVPLAGLVDTAVLGRLPDIRFLAGVALASILFDYLYWSFGFLRMGTTGTTAQALGRGDRRETVLVLYRSLGLALGLGATILLARAGLREAGFALLAGTAEVETAGRAYFDARILGAPATLANFVFLGWFLGREESRHALAMTVVANVTNVVLDYVLILRWGLGARGAGLATMIGQYAMLAVAVAIWLRVRRPVDWRRSQLLDRERIAELVRLNRDILIRTLCLISTFAIFTNASSVLGTGVLAANAILLRFLNLASYLIDGAAFATESLAGIFLGRGDRSSLRRLVRLSLLVGEGFAILFLIALLAAPETVFGLMTTHADVVRRSVALGWWLVPVLAFGAVAYILDGLFLGTTEGALLRNAMAVSTLGVFLPVAVAALAAGSPHLLWFAMAAFMAARAATLGWGCRRRFAARVG